MYVLTHNILSAIPMGCLCAIFSSMQMNISGEVFVGPERIPSGLREDTTPPRILQALDGVEDTAAVARSLALDAGYKMEVNEAPVCYLCLHLCKARRCCDDTGSRGWREISPLHDVTHYH